MYFIQNYFVFKSFITLNKKLLQALRIVNFDLSSPLLWNIFVILDLIKFGWKNIFCLNRSIKSRENGFSVPLIFSLPLYRKSNLSWPHSNSLIWNFFFLKKNPLLFLAKLNVCWCCCVFTFFALLLFLPWLWCTHTNGKLYFLLSTKSKR